MKTKIGLLFLFVAVGILFQNCGKAPAGDQGSATSQSVVPTETVTGVTSGLTQISYNANINSAKVSGKASVQTALVVDVSVDQGFFTLTDLATQKKLKCSLSVTREQNIKAILSTSRICQPVINANSMYCMALPAGEDVVLSNAERKVGLAKPICHSGTYLCDGNDDKLRAELESLRLADSSSCQTI